MNVPTADSSIFDILSEYIDLGFAIIPIWGVQNGHCACPKGADCKKSPGKHPNGRLVPNGLSNATRDKSILREWIRIFPDGNWALRAGQPLTNGGFAIVVDVDPRNGGHASIEQIQGTHGALPESWTQDSGGNGHHIILRSEESCASRAPAPGIELLGDGKYFLVYPSKHLSGGEYTWALGKSPSDIKIAKAPEWVLETARGTLRPDRDSGDTARDTVLGEAFALAGMIGVPLQDGSIAVRCPWADEHSDNRGKGEDSSTVVLPPAGGSRFGGFRCLHSHCSQRRWQDVMQILPPEASTAARLKYPLRPVAATIPEPPVTVEGDKSTFDKDLATCKQKLSYKTTKSGFKIQSDLINAVTILTYDPRWRGILMHNDFAQNIHFSREPEWHSDDKPRVPFANVTEDAINCLDAWFRRIWGIEIGIEKIMQAIAVVAHRDSFNPLQTYLDQLHWDGVPRVDMWLHTYLGAEDTPYTRVAGSKWLISAVARAYKPGCKADHVLILEGPQGRGKSTALGLLAGPAWFSDTPIDIGNKDAYISLQGKWIIELAELASLHKTALDRAKAFFSSPKDTYRPAYGRMAADFPRQCVFAGTVNLDQYLSDETGNRRFWPVACGIIDLESLAAERGQIGAEVVQQYKGWVGRGSNLAECPWWPTYAERKLFEREQDERVVEDVWKPTVEKWLNCVTAKKMLTQTGCISAEVILLGALEIEPSDQDRIKVGRLTNVMNSLKWGRSRIRQGRARSLAYRPNSLETAI